MKKSGFKAVKHLPKITLIAVSLIELLVFPTEIGNGVKAGLTLLGESIIPALFPFMILSTYISFSPYSRTLSRLFNKPARKLFNVDGAGLTAVISGILGGYPIGAKTVSDFYTMNVLSKEDSHRLLSWCVNPSPSFVITAIGTFMLNNKKSGIIMYSSILLASLTIGIAVRFTGKNSSLPENYSLAQITDNKNIFINSVASGSKAMLSICGWVLVFSAATAGVDCLCPNERVSLFIKALSEVTTGCKSVAATNFPLPLICAIIGFGGFAVIFQIAPYLQKCGYDLKLFICWRALTGALSAFYCSQIIRLFPDEQSVSQIILLSGKSYAFSHSITASIILIFTCIVLILEVDNKRKVW